MAHGPPDEPTKSCRWTVRASGVSARAHQRIMMLVEIQRFLLIANTARLQAAFRSSDYFRNDMGLWFNSGRPHFGILHFGVEFV
jgi:hypothetical protein